jgi:hypothetical protein
LREAERKAFRTQYNDGLWDILLGCFFLMFVIAPYLSESLGDFWSSAVFLPFWGLVYLVVRLLRAHVVRPRIGEVAFGPVRRAKLMRFTLVMLIVNVVVLILGGILAAAFSQRLQGEVFGIVFGVFLLAGSSLAAYLLDFNRLLVYGLLAGLSPMVGEWLWDRGLVTHHGFPVTFGVTAGVMIVTGLVLFVRLILENPLPPEGIPSEGA